MKNKWSYRLNLRMCLQSALSAVMVLAMALPCWAQSAVPAPRGYEQQSASDYRIGPGDVLTVTVGDAEELSGKYRVTDEGYLALPGVPMPIRAEGLTALQLSQAVTEALQKAQLFKEPSVSIFVEEFHSRTVTVLGAVTKPSVYPLQKPTTLLEMLSMAGGLTPMAGNQVTVVRRGVLSSSGTDANNRASAQQDSALKIDLASLLDGKDPSLNIQIHAGDVVTVATAPVVYVVGAVTKPGGYVLEDPTSGITVLQALARAEGFSSIAARSRSVIFRRQEDAEQPEKIPIDLGKIMEGKRADVQLQANDILFVPESGFKKNVLGFGRAAVSGLITGVSIYGLGPKIAR